MNIHRKLAGVPVWGWMLAAAGAIALGIYFRHRANATNNASNASSGSTFGDATNALAGGTTADTPAGLDPALADLLTNAQSALIDQGNQLAAVAGSDVPTSDFGSGFDTPASTNVASSSGAGATVAAPTFVPHGTFPREPGTNMLMPIAPRGPSGKTAATSLGFSPTPVNFGAPVANKTPSASGSFSAPSAPSPGGGLFVKAV
jgi:hypothetical protein